MPGCPPNVIGRLVPGTSAALPGALASATDALPITSGVSGLSAFATRMRIAEPPTDTRTRLRTVACEGPPVAAPVGEAPHAAIHVEPLAVAVMPKVAAAIRTARSFDRRAMAGGDRSGG